LTGKIGIKMSKKISDSEYKSYFMDKNKRKRKIFGNIPLKAKLIVLGVFLILLIAFMAYIISGLPSLEQLENPKPELATKVYTVDGELLGQFFIENRSETNIDSLPGYLINALIATEDRKFYDHWGVDLTRFAKAMIKNVFTFSREGASTITQQLAKNLYKLKGKDENIFAAVVRKIREWMTAIQIEQNYTKDEILESYLNVSYFGRSAYGIESAAKVYFDKKASELTLPEAAVFIALLKSPEYYDPIKKKENSLRRRNLVMHNMVVNDMLSEEKYQKLKTVPIVTVSEKAGIIRSIAPHFMEYVRQQLEIHSEKYGYNLYRDGLNIYTTIDYRMQKYANDAAAKHLTEYQALFNKNWNWDENKSLLISLIDKAIRNSSLYRNASTKEEKAQIYNTLKNRKSFVDSVKTVETKVQVGFVIIEPSTGQIKAMVGGENQRLGRGLNHVTGIRRQPGSAFKTIVYTAAIDNGYYPAYTILNQKFDFNGWAPSNADEEYGGYITLREALARSVNVVSGRMTISEVAPPNKVVKYAKRMGINSPLSPYPSLALGTSEVTPLELTAAFGTLANNGVYVNPNAILRIEDKNGILIDQFIPEYSEAVSPQTAAIMTAMMQDVLLYGTGAGVGRYFHRPAAGKTGTTQDFADAWFVGYTPQLVGGVWVGFDDHRVKFTDWYGQGARAALPIWAMFMEETYKNLDLPLKYFTPASGVDTVSFCLESMNLGDPRIATQNCPTIFRDIINSKYMPRECEIHQGSDIIIREDKRGDAGW